MLKGNLRMTKLRVLETHGTPNSEFSDKNKADFSNSAMSANPSFLFAYAEQKAAALFSSAVAVG